MRIKFIYEDVKLVLFSNLDALVRDQRISLTELVKVEKIDYNEFRPIMIYEAIVSLDQKIGTDMKPEDYGIDSKRALLSLINVKDPNDEARIYENAMI